jgi:DNA invertase Pin-like site-specific DNA recombinase
VTTVATLYICVIKKCSASGCDTWFIGTPRSRYCDQHKRTQYERMTANRNGTHRRSRYTERQIQHMRAMFLTYSAAEVAKRFGCNRSLVYKYVHQDPERYRLE